MTQKHLDSQYRRRWELFLLADGTEFDSRQINWRDVDWDQVVKITIHMNGQVHEFTNDQPNFKFFMNFRWAGRQAQFESGAYKGHTQVDLWTVGWCDGKLCHLSDIDFYSGDVVKTYSIPVSELKGHVHPSVEKHLS